MNFTQQGEQIGSSPAMVQFNNKLYIGFQGNNSHQSLFLDSSSDAVNLNGAIEYPAIRIGSAPSMAVLNGALYVAFNAQNGSNHLFVCRTTDVQTFSCPQQNIYLINGPSLAVFNGSLYVAFESQVGDQLGITYTTDGVNFATPVFMATKIGGSPALVSQGNKLTVAFRADDSSHQLFLQSTTDGVNWGKAYNYTTTMGRVTRGGCTSRRQSA